MQGLKSSMKNKRPSPSFGFTITEVIIVLAVAALIMTVVFAAIPQLKRNQRDSERKNIALRLKTELESFQANKQGVYPFMQVAFSAKWCDTQSNFVSPYTNTCWDWYSTYINGQINIKDPGTGNNFGIAVNNATTYDYKNRSPWTPGEFFIVVGGQCNVGSVSGTPGTETSKKYALMTSLEKPGTWFCIDNR
jgi:prepilin-type N-terminal cleavage/methylation domain-containing protein